MWTSWDAFRREQAGPDVRTLFDMGFAKRMMEQEEGQGWSLTDEYVCAGCVDDYALASAIEADQEAESACDFCGSCPAAPLDSLLLIFVNGLKNEYGTADDEGVSWDGREGGYQWERTWDTYDLIADFGDVLTGEGLVQAMQNAVHDKTWVEENFAWRRRDEVLNESWDRFCTAVKYETRFVLWLREDVDLDEALSTGEVPPAFILQELGRLIERLGVAVRTLPAGYPLWRARTHHEANVPTGAEALGTPPTEKAIHANRMSPAGIPMFYGAADPNTAVREVAVRSQHDWVTAGRFETSRDVIVVDFTRLPATPSMFDPEWGADRRYLRFLNRFAAQLSEPARETLEQIDYVPTQIVTEYLLRVFGEGKTVDGLLYASALTGEVCAVLDVKHPRCVDQVPGWGLTDAVQLGLAPRSSFSRKLAEDERGA